MANLYNISMIASNGKFVQYFHDCIKWQNISYELSGYYHLNYYRFITLMFVNIKLSWDIGGREPAYQRGTLFTNLSSIFNQLVFIAIK